MSQIWPYLICHRDAIINDYQQFIADVISDMWSLSKIGFLTHEKTYNVYYVDLRTLMVEKIV